jgi:hypothetical protein
MVPVRKRIVDPEESVELDNELVDVNSKLTDLK